MADPAQHGVRRDEAPVADTDTRVAAVVVTFHPDRSVLASILERLAAESVEWIVVVDNATPALAHTVPWDETRVDAELLRMPVNGGPAAAQNAGIRHALARGASHVLLLDQDSVPAPGMVARLLAAWASLTERGAAPSAVGARYDAADGRRQSVFVRFGWLGFRRVECDAASLVGVDFLISSGSLFPRAALERIGLMDERLFIDHIDTDWFLRARAAGLEAYGVCDALMRHSLGEGALRIWLGRWRSLPRHRPFRHYYIFRNSLLLYRRPYAPWRWIANDLVRLGVMLILYPLLSKPRLAHARMMARGIRDGVAGRDGYVVAVNTP